MVKRVIAFGDSWTHGHGVEEDQQYQEQIFGNDFIDRLRRSGSWVRWLADKYQVPYVNMGRSGFSNVDIKNSIKDVLPMIDKSTDLIVVMLTFPYRHHFTQKVNALDMPLANIYLSITTLLEGYEYFILNSFYPTFKHEPEIKEELNLDRFIEIDGTVSSYLTNYEEDNDISVWEYNLRKVGEDTMFEKGGFHPNTLGYKLIADWIYNKINERYQQYE